MQKVIFPEHSKSVHYTWTSLNYIVAWQFRTISNHEHIKKNKTKVWWGATDIIFNNQPFENIKLLKHPNKILDFLVIATGNRTFNQYRTCFRFEQNTSLAVVPVGSFDWTFRKTYFFRRTRRQYQGQPEPNREKLTKQTLL